MATPPTFVAGQPLTAAQMNTIGLHLVKTQTVGSGVSSVTVTGAFSADYDNYLITLDGVAYSSTDTTLWMRPGADASAATYYSAGWFVLFTGLGPGYHSNNGTTAGIGVGITSTTVQGLAIDVFDPYLAKWTRAAGHLSSGDSYIAHYGGVQKNTSQYTSVQFYPASGTMTGGTIRVFGYRNSLT